MKFSSRSLRLIILAALIPLGLAATLNIFASDLFVEPDVNVLLTVTGDDGAGSFGWAAENLGDINGDGVNDFITSAPFLNGIEGKIYVYSGSDGALLNAVAADGPQLLGYSATSAGDVNGDGVTDYAAGAPIAGRAVVYSGADHSTLLDLTVADGSGFGASVGKAGDVNGDGHGDLIVGAVNASHTFTEAGRVYLYSGADGAILWTVDGASVGSSLGSAVGQVGDVNGDGVPDQTAGAPGAGKHGRGEVYVLSGVDGSIIYTLKPVGLPGEAGSFGVFFALGAGDINADGIPDIFVGDWNAERGNVNGTGRAYVFSGADGSRLHVLDAETNGDGFGPGRGAGDVNGDGYGDLIIGAYTSSAGAPFGGKNYVYSGRDGSVLRTMTGSTPGALLGVDALTIGDVNGDNLTDYILTGSGVVHIVAGNP